MSVVEGQSQLSDQGGGDARSRVFTLFLAAGIALAALAISDYRFGLGDQAQYLVQVVDLEQPDALGADPYREAFEPLRSGFWWFVSAVSTEATRPLVCLALTLLVTFVNALLLIRIGLVLLTPTAGSCGMLLASLPALLLVVPKERNWFGLVWLSDVELTATLAVMPLIFGSVLAWLRGRERLCMFLGLLAIPVHGQTGAYLLTAWWVVTMYEAIRLGRWPVRAIVVGLFGALMLALEWRTGRLDAVLHPGFERISMGLFAELIDPGRAPLTAWAPVVAILTLGALAWPRGSTPGGVETTSARGQRRLSAWALASLVFPIVGLALLRFGVDEPVLWRLMVGRSLMLPQIAALILLGAWCAAHVGERGMRGAGSFVVALSVVAWPVAWLPRPAAATALLLTVFVMAFTSRWRVETSVVSPRRAGLAWATVVVALVAVGAVRLAGREFPWLQRGAPAAWIETQAWARAHTAPGTWFVTPPYLSGWRIGSHRPTHGELLDGGLLFYSGEPVVAWATRMRLVGISGPRYWSPGAFSGDASAGDGRSQREAYHAAVQKNLPELVEAGVATYLVLERTHDVAVGTLVHENDGFRVRRIASAVVDRR